MQRQYARVSENESTTLNTNVIKSKELSKLPKNSIKITNELSQPNFPVESDIIIIFFTFTANRYKL